MRVAVTGGLSSGKTTFCLELQKLGAYYVSADQILHQILVQDQEIVGALVDLLGDDILVNDVIDRAKMADIVFRSKKKLHEIEAILHPAIQAKIDAIYAQAVKEHKHSLFVVEVPLLFEAYMAHAYDATIAILTEENLAAERYKLETNRLPDDYSRRMQHQLPPKEKAKNADFVIENNRSKQEFQEKAKALYQVLIDKQEGVIKLLP